MIQEALTHKNNPALTSDRWHVVHARWTGTPSGEPRFQRSIVSEHASRQAATEAARAMVSALAEEMAKRPRQRRDQIFVRRPNFKSLKAAHRRERRRK